MDIYELVSQSTITAAVLGNGEDFLLVRVDKDYPGKDRDVERAVARGLFYCGTLGWNGSEMSVALEPDPDTLQPMRLAAEGFGVLVARLTTPQSPAESEPEVVQAGDSVGWCEKLYALPDARN